MSNIRRSFLIVFFIVAVFFSAAYAHMALVPVFKRAPNGKLVFTRSYREAPEKKFGKRKILGFDKPSLRDILHRKGFQHEASPFLKAAGQYCDTIRVMVIRISFETDREDALSSIATGGDFDYSENGDAVIDPSPHDYGYFNSHMEALRNFLHFESCGKVELEWDIFPKARQDSYKLSDIADYGPGAGGYWTQELLVKFFRDCIEAADNGLAAQGYPVHFRDYDAIIIAHSGADLQSDVNNDSPNDVPSYFATLGPEDQFTVDGGSTVIKDGSVIPETGSQDGYEAGIAAVLAHEFGHQLGLPDLYNVYNNGSSVGVWDLMDSGGMLGAYIPDKDGKFHYVEGVIPSGYCAWSRYFLGWVDADTINTISDINLPAVEKCPARVVRIDVSSDEYFLMENRSAEIDGLLTAFVADTNGVILGTANCLNCGDSIPDNPQWELTNGYDILMPTESEIPTYNGGPGILIWHVDDRLIEKRWEDNVINSIKPFGVALLEANGVVDLGDPYSSFSMGWYDDAYYAGNNSTLSDSTLPSAWSNWQIPTGAFVRNISARDTLMSFKTGINGIEGVAKWAIGDSESVKAFASLPAEHRAILIDSGNRVWDTRSGSIAITLSSPCVGYPAFAADFQGTHDAIVIGEESGVIHAFSADTWDELDGWPRSVSGRLKTFSVIGRTEDGCIVAVADEAGGLYLFDRWGKQLKGSPMSLSDAVLGNIVIASDTTGMAKGIFVLIGDNDQISHGWLFRYDIPSSIHTEPLSISAGYPVHLDLTDDELKGKFYLLGGDIIPDEEGDEVYVISRKSGRVFLIGSNGILMARDRDDHINSVPALCDVDNDGSIDLVFSDGSSIFAIGHTGANLLGWPRNLNSYCVMPQNVKMHSALIAMKGSGSTSVVAGTDSGLLFNINSKGELYGGLPVKISSSIMPSIDVTSNGREAVMAYIDGSSAKWRKLGFGPLNLRASWLSAWGNLSRSSYLASSTVESVALRDWRTLNKNLIVYPNPSNGDRVAFHFPAPFTGKANLTIMTLSGELVAKREKNLSGGDDEIVVNMRNKVSGIYLCRLIVRDGSGHTAEALRKFAIVK